MTDERPSRQRVVEAFTEAVEWWHSRLDDEIEDHTEAGEHPDRPTTAREYFIGGRGFDAEVVDDEIADHPEADPDAIDRDYTDGRGFAPETVEEWKLGWAPPEGGLWEHLRAEGFDAETVKATGVFGDPQTDPTCLFRGRYVLPYYDEDGNAVYAIARATGDKGGGDAGYDGHPEDFIAGKYCKLAHSNDRVQLTEPILGRHTLDDRGYVVVAEGITDAITVSEAGHPVLSPVAKEFKREHMEELAELVTDEHDVDRVYVVPDADPPRFSRIDSEDVPDEPDRINEVVDIPKVAPGPGGALRTANYLSEKGVDARVAELPGLTRAKLDLDDYLTDWDHSFEHVLVSARSPSQHPKYTEATASQFSDKADEPASGDTVTASADADRDYNAVEGGLSSLSLSDLNPDLTPGYRGKNPLGHTGGSENYFVVITSEEGDAVGKDWKRPGNPVFNALTYLLVEIGEREVSNPEGPLTPSESWAAWSAARRRGLLDAQSIVPTPALEHIARDRELYNFSDLEGDVEELPAKAHNAALYWVKKRWPETTDEIDADEPVTARNYRDRTDQPTRTWEDVRYVYDESKEHGRRAARALLQSRYEFMTVDESETLYVYDPETGVFTDELGDVRAEIYDGLDPSGHWSRHEKNEIVAGLKQTNVVQQRHTNAGDRAGQLRCVANGVLDVVNRELHDHDPAFRFTRRIPVEYDPEADPAPYREFVDSLVGRDADRKALFEMVGHALLPEANERHRLFLMLTGDTTNGKSEFFNRVRALLNGPEREESNTASVKMSKLAQNRFSQHAVYGAAANIAGEVNGKKIRNTANLKDMTGGDSVELEPKGQSSFFDTVNATQMFAANDPPIIGERDKEAIAKRIVPVELPYTFVENPQGPDEREAVPQSELKAELETPKALSGFLNLALEGVQRLEANGDVSLPESPQERLRQYEKAADPMREFGERCLTSDPDDYVVKADVTTLYKEFAAQRGDEIGQSVGRTLHKVLRGVPDLNYTESRPESPDYTDTSLPLEGWDERKRVVARCSLTEEGMEYAEAAGLIADDPDEDKQDDDNPALAARDPQYGASFNATVQSVNDGEYTREEQGRLEGPHGTYIAYIVPGGNDTTLITQVGEELRFEDVTLRTDDDGLLEAVIDDSTAYEVVQAESGPDADRETETTATATDGGNTDSSWPADAFSDVDVTHETLRGQLIEWLRAERPERVTVAVAAGAIDAAPDSVEDALDKLVKEGLLIEHKKNGYEVNR